VRRHLLLPPSTVRADDGWRDVSSHNLSARACAAATAVTAAAEVRHLWMTAQLTNGELTVFAVPAHGFYVTQVATNVKAS
jgi:hypothetical protein